MQIHPLPRFVFHAARGSLGCTAPFPLAGSLTEREALELSIQKWEIIVDRLREGLAIEGDGGYATCACCHKYCGNKKACHGCPIMKQTGQPYCVGSPYLQFSDEPTLKNAYAELNFLRSLLLPPPKRATRKER